VSNGRSDAKLNILGVEMPIPANVAIAILIVAGLGTVWWNWELVCGHLPYCYRNCRDPAHGIESWTVVNSIPKDSGWVGGGSSPGQYCGAQLSALQTANPRKRYELAGSHEDHTTERRPFKEDYYRYTCEFRVSEPVYKLASSEHCSAR
jgi:hypothetical protein